MGDEDLRSSGSTTRNPEQARQAVMVAGSHVTPLSASDPIGLVCGEEGCRANCCKNGPPIVLNPYEISLICRESGLRYDDLLDIVETGRSDGFPLLMLPRDPACSFWSETGCVIYKARPLACRLFPIGRVFESGRSHMVLPEKNLCAGLVPSPSTTIADYLDRHDAKTQIEMADRWIEFVSDMERLKLPDRPVTSIAFHLIVYDPQAPLSSSHQATGASAEDLFLLRLETARREIPRYFRLA